MRLGLRTTLGISLALHAAVLAAIVRWGPKPQPPVRQWAKPPPAPIAFVMPTKRPPVVAPTDEAPTQSLPPARSGRGEATPAPSSPRGAPPPGAAGRRPTQGPRTEAKGDAAQLGHTSAERAERQDEAIVPLTTKHQEHATAERAERQDEAQDSAGAADRGPRAPGPIDLFAEVEGAPGRGPWAPGPIDLFAGVEGAAGRGPRAPGPIDLFAGVEGAARALPGAGPAAPGDPNAAVRRATERLQGLRQSLRGKRTAEVVPRGVKAFGERLNRTFVPDMEALKHVSRSSTGTAFTQPHASAQKEPHLPMVHTIAAQQMRGSMADRTLTLGEGVGTSFDHEASTLRVEVVVHHDAAGKPQRWSIPKPSGARTFDEAALMSVRDAAHTLPVWQDGVPRETHWEFELQALRWGRAELLLDPGFVAPGREIENGFFGKTTVVQAVRLVSLTLAPIDQGSGSTKQPD